MILQIPHSYRGLSFRVFRYSLVLFLGLVSCVSVPMAKKSDDIRAKNFYATPGKANVYVFRDSTFGASIPVPLEVNGEPVAEMTPDTYALVVLPPGAHTLTSESENSDEIQLVLEPNRNYFVRQSVRKGHSTARVKLKKVPRGVGKDAILDCQLVQGTLL